MINILAIMIATTALAAEAGLVRCHQEPSDRQDYWSWRLIDGRKCWFKGHASLPKSMLHWVDDDDTARPTVPADNDRAISIDPDAGDVTTIDVKPAQLNNFDRKWQELMLDLRGGAFFDPQPMQWKTK
jgi:hypothetical protein